VGVLAEHDWQEWDRRYWSWSLKSDKPMASYDDIQQEVEATLAPPEPIPPERESWYKS
jgi:hypothetical protein